MSMGVTQLPPIGGETAITSSNTKDTAKLDPLDDFFITQRGEKIVLGNELYGVPASKNVSSLMDKRRTLQSTLLLQKKKEMEAVQELLEKKRIAFSKRMEECKFKQVELRAKQKQIRERVLKFEKFLKENDAKRQRAHLKAHSERRLKEQKEVELTATLENLNREKAKAAKILLAIERHRIYERFLQGVIDSMGSDYLDINEPHINDLIMRYKTLQETSEDLICTVQKNRDDIERQQLFLLDLVKEKNDEILVYNSELGNKQKKVDFLKQEVAYLEQRIEQRYETGKEKMRVSGESKLALNNIYNRVLSWKYQKPAVGTDSENSALDTSPSTERETPREAAAQNETITPLHKIAVIEDKLIDIQLLAHKLEQIQNRESK